MEESVEEEIELVRSILVILAKQRIGIWRWS